MYGLDGQYHTLQGVVQQLQRGVSFLRAIGIDLRVTSILRGRGITTTSSCCGSSSSSSSSSSGILMIRETPLDQFHQKIFDERPCNGTTTWLHIVVLLERERELEEELVGVVVHKFNGISM